MDNLENTLGLLDAAFDYLNISLPKDEGKGKAWEAGIPSWNTGGKKLA